METPNRSGSELMGGLTVVEDVVVLAAIVIGATLAWTMLSLPAVVDAGLYVIV